MHRSPSPGRLGLLLLAALFPACDSDEGDAPLGFAGAVTVSAGPHAAVPLVALATFETRGAVDEVIIEAIAADHTRRYTATPSGSAHEVPIIGLRADRSYAVRVGLRGGGDEVFSEAIAWQTPPLPDDLPPLTLLRASPAAMEPGVVLFAPNRWTTATSFDPAYGLILVVDADGEVVWWYRSDDGAVDDLRQLENGNLLYNRGGLQIVEMTLTGAIVGHWQATGILPLVVEGATGVPVDTFHHEVFPFDDDTLVAVSTELRTFDDYPSSEDDPTAPRERAGVVGDVIATFHRDGTLVDRINLLDVLDPYRIGYDSLHRFWDVAYRNEPNGTRDWSHTNALIHDPSDDTFILSVRHQDAVIKLRRDTHEVVWIIGPDGDWGALADRVLTPVGDTVVPYHAHAPTLSADGTLFLYDNGNWRARPFGARLPAADNRSRAVELRVDEVAGTYEEVWAFDVPIYTPFLGDADPLPQTGNVLVTGGGVVALDGQPHYDEGEGHKRGRIYEVTGAATPEVVFELEVGSADPTTQSWHVYRAEKLTRW